MPEKVPPFALHFEMVFLESYARLGQKERKAVDKAVGPLATNPRHPSLYVRKAKNIKAKYALGGLDVFIGYASQGLRISFEHGPEPGMITFAQLRSS